MPKGSRSHPNDIGTSPGTSARATWNGDVRGEVRSTTTGSPICSRASAGRPGTQATSSRSITSSEPSRKAACEAIPARWCSHMWSSGVRTSSGRSSGSARVACNDSTSPISFSALAAAGAGSSRQEHATWRRSSRCAAASTTGWVSRVRLTSLDSEPELLDLVDQVAGVGGQAGGIDALAGHALDPGPQERVALDQLAHRPVGRVVGAGSGGQARARAAQPREALGIRVDEIDGIGRDPPFLAGGGVSARPQQPVVGPGRDQVHVRLVLAGVEPVEALGFERSLEVAPRRPPQGAGLDVAGAVALGRLGAGHELGLGCARGRPATNSDLAAQRIAQVGHRVLGHEAVAPTVQRRGGRKLDHALQRAEPARALHAERPQLLDRGRPHARPSDLGHVRGAGIAGPARRAPRPAPRGPGDPPPRCAGAAGRPRRRPRGAHGARPATNPRTARRAESASTPAGSTSASVAVHASCTGASRATWRMASAKGSPSTPSRASGALASTPRSRSISRSSAASSTVDSAAPATASAVAVFASVSTRARRPSSRRSTPTSTWVPPRTHTSPLGTAPISHAGSARSVSVIAAIAREPARAARPGGGPAGSAPTT